MSKSLTCNRPSRLLGIVTHFVTVPGLLRACSSASRAPLVFFSFLTRASTAFSAHFSSSSPCFHPRSRLTAGEVKLNRELRLDILSDCISGDYFTPSSLVCWIFCSVKMLFLIVVTQCPVLARRVGVTNQRENHRNTEMDSRKRSGHTLNRVPGAGGAQGNDAW